MSWFGIGRSKMIKPDKEIDQFDNETPFVYLFVREDLPPVQQLIQAAHAAHEAGIMFGRCDSGGWDKNDVSHFCVFGVSDEEHLFRIHKKLMQNDIGCYLFHEPDFDMGFSAIATEPLIGERRKLIGNHKLLRMLKRHIW